MGLPGFRVLDNEIRNEATGSTFAFEGLRHNVTGLKSYEGIDIAWIEEAETIRPIKDLLNPLLPMPFVCLFHGRIIPGFLMNCGRRRITFTRLIPAPPSTFGAGLLGRIPRHKFSMENGGLNHSSQRKIGMGLISERIGALPFPLLLWLRFGSKAEVS
jgi:hypothetical protein